MSDDVRDDAKPYTMDDVQAWVEMRWERERLDERTMARIRATVEQVERVRAVANALLNVAIDHVDSDYTDGVVDASKGVLRALDGK